jgi:predicted DNA-binding transcriptional regulator AlpA
MVVLSPTPGPVPDRIVRLSAVPELLGMSKSTIHALIRSGALPRPLALGPRARGYRLSTLDRWMNEREAAAQQVVGSCVRK